MPDWKDLGLKEGSREQQWLRNITYKAMPSSGIDDEYYKACWILSLFEELVAKREEVRNAE